MSGAARSSASCCPPSLSVFTSDGDDSAAKRDPTQTLALRNTFARLSERKFATLRRLVRDAVLVADVLCLASVTVASLLNSMMTRASASGPVAPRGMTSSTIANKLRMFQSWIDEALRQVVLGGDGSWMRPYIESGYRTGRNRAEKIVGQQAFNDQDRIDALFHSTVIELQGICEAVSQGALRVVSRGLMSGSRSRSIAVEISSVIDKVGVSRATAMVQTYVVRAHADATLDVFEAAKISRVGTIAEHHIVAPILPTARPSFDELLKDAKRATKRSRRIIKRSRARAGESLVEVLTAGDLRVCPICEDISAGGPYPISQARGLIPAHIRCRCAFVPFFDLRFAPVEKE